MAVPLVRPLAEVRATDVAIAGGKGANLGELIAAGFLVPDLFVLTTEAYDRAATRLDPAKPDETAYRLQTTQIPAPVAREATAAYEAMGQGKVAVRSSATAEDLPGASFAGQQDTFLDIEGGDALLDAIRRCWASLWNERAVAYRRDHGIDDATVSLAVVVQRMVDAAAAGVLFTADPITGRRQRAVIDGAPGLGEAVVSGSVVPDHYAVDTRTGDVLDRRTTTTTPVLTDTQLRELAATGQRIEDHLGSPQDIEFAFDTDGKLWIVQSRPITTLFPLPEGAPGDPNDLRVYFSASVAQGYFEPITPMGMEPFRAIGNRLAKAFAHGQGDAKVSSPVVDAGLRWFIDVTPVVRDSVGREVFQRLTAVGEARTSTVVGKLVADPRLAPRGGSRRATVRKVIPLLLRSGIPLYALRLLNAPDTTRRRLIQEIERATEIPPGATASATTRLDAVERLMREAPAFLFPRLLGMVVAGFASFLAIGRLLGNRATEAERLTLTRALPHNPTTEMDLELWALTTEVRRDPASRESLERSTDELAAAFHSGALPAPLQEWLRRFLDRYGFRSVGEIDVGVARWSEDPSHLLGAIANYLQLGEDALAPDQMFRDGAGDAAAMRASLLARVHGPRRRLLRFAIDRAQALMGSRELPKYMLTRRLFTPIRVLLQLVGAELVAADRLATSDDIFFLTLDEARQAVAGADFRRTVAERRATHEREHARRHIPRLLLSDGTDAEIALVEVTEGDLRGSPASPGTVTGKARVILSPRGAHLEPGEILVAPSTDPGWTPLFLTAGGLVMEMGGMMSHGAVVAREYGIPAVVGVPGATERIKTGDEITIDGSAGVVSVDEESPQRRLA